MKTTHFARALGLALVLSPFACGSSDSRNPPAGTTSITIVQSPDQRAFMIIPEGAVPAGTQITITPKSTPAGPAYDLAPDGLVFAKPAVLFHYDDPSKPRPFRSVTITSSNGKTEVPEQTIVSYSTEVERRLYQIVRVDHFSTVLFENGEHELADRGELLLDYDGSISADVGTKRSFGVRARFNPLFQFDPAALIISSEDPQTAPIADIQRTPPVDGVVNYTITVACKKAGYSQLTYEYPGINDTKAVVWVQCRVPAVPTHVMSSDEWYRAKIAEIEQELAAQKAKDEAAGLDQLAVIMAHLFERPVSDDERSQAAGALHDVDYQIEGKIDVPKIVPLHKRVKGKVSFVKKSPTTPAVRFEGIFVQSLTSGLGLYAVGDATPKGLLDVAYAPRTVVTGTPSSPLEVEFEIECLRKGTWPVAGWVEVSDASRPSAGFTGPRDPVTGSLIYEGPGARAHGDGSAGADGVTHYPYEIPIVCTDGSAGDALMLADNRKVARSGGSWVTAAPGVAANAIHAADTVASQFAPLDEEMMVYGGVTSFTTNPGPTSIKFASSVQNATATLSGGKYTFAGLVGGAAFGATDALTITATPPGSTTPEQTMVPAPTIPLDANAILGAPAGGDTVVTLPDGTFDELYVTGAIVPISGAPVGASGFMRISPAASLTLTGTSRTTTILRPQDVQAFAAMGMKVSAIYVAALRRTTNTTLFPGLRPIDVQAGRMFQLAPADLAL